MQTAGGKKIAIVGGGPAGLAAAFELTKSGRIPGECVTVYQAGWRLGGKCATGRDDQRRIVEHGLHLWFGYYENAFQLLRELYAELRAAPRRFQAWTDAFEPAPLTEIGDASQAGRYLPLCWPRRPGSPGDGRPLRVWDCVTGVLELLSQFHDSQVAGGAAETARIALAPVHARAFRAVFSSRPETLAPREAVQHAVAWSAKIAAGLNHPEHIIGLKALLRASADAQRRSLKAGAHDKLLAETTDIVAAFASGLVEDILLGGASIPELDETDFRDWLVLNGAEPSSVDGSPLLNALYDTMFQYGECDGARPSYGAGTAAQVVLRFLGGYKGDAIWKARAGLGEALISPLYQTLKARGVRFAFFHKLERVELSADGGAVARLHFALQAPQAEGEFEPTFEFNGLTCWPNAPPKGSSPELETRWSQSTELPNLALEQGRDFSDVVLAIPGGALKCLGDDLGPCDELIRANPRFRQMAESVALVPSLAVQVWSLKSLDELGWPLSAATMVSGPQPLQIWADMSQTLACEDWPADGPKSVHYFCNVFGSQAYRDPAGAAPANEIVRQLTKDWFDDKAGYFWPNAVAYVGGDVSGFLWTTLEDKDHRPGARRLEAQIVKANVDPWACCCGSGAGATGWRLKTDEAGFKHLYLAGAWIDTGFNTECVEAAVMSGKQAARALTGAPISVAGETFLHASEIGGQSRLARDILGWLVFAEEVGR